MRPTNSGTRTHNTTPLNTTSQRGGDEQAVKKQRVEPTLTIADQAPAPFALNLIVHGQDAGWTIVEVQAGNEPVLQQGRYAFQCFATVALPGVRIELRDNMWMLIQAVDSRIPQLVEHFQHLCSAIRDAGAGADLLLALVGNVSAWAIASFVRSGSLRIEAGPPPRLQWHNLQPKAIAANEDHVQKLLLSMTQSFPQLVLDALPDLVASTYQPRNGRDDSAKSCERQIAELLDLWCAGQVTGELRSAQKWIGILLGAPWRQDPGKTPTLTRRWDYLKQLHACSCAQGQHELAHWAVQEAGKLDLGQAKAWARAQAQGAQTHAVPRSDPLQSALARPTFRDAGSLHACASKAAEQLARVLGCPAFIDRLSQEPAASDILRLLDQGVVALEQLPVAPGALAIQTRWRIAAPVQPTLIVALANLLWSTHPALASKVVELLLAAWQASPEGEARTLLRHTLIGTAQRHHADHPAILQSALWLLVLSEALSGDMNSVPLHTDCEQLLLAWLRFWSSVPFDMQQVAVTLRHALLARRAQPPSAHDGLVACLEQMHIAARRDRAHLRWTEWALLALRQCPAPAAPAALRRCLEATVPSSHLAVLKQQLDRGGWRNLQALPAGDAHSGSQLLPLLKLVPPPLRTDTLLMMAKRHAQLTPGAGQSEAGVVPPEEFLPFALQLLHDACLLQDTPMPLSAEIDMLLSACLDCLSRCPQMAHDAPGRLTLLKDIASPLADLLALRGTTTSNGQRLCWEILLRYVEGELALGHQQVLCFLRQVPFDALSGACLWVSRKQAWQVLQALEQQLMSQSGEHPGDALNKVAEHARKLFRDASFDPPRQRALLAWQQLESGGWPHDLQLLVDVYRGPWGAQRAPIIQRLQSGPAGSPPPKPKSDEMAALIQAQAAAAQILAEAAALMAWGIGAQPGRLSDLAKACLRWLEAEPVGLPDVTELACAVAAVLASPLEPGDARQAWEHLRDLLLSRWRLGGYGIEGAVLLDVAWPHLKIAGPDAGVAEDLVRVYAWHEDGALRQRVIDILKAHPHNPDARAALDRCQEHENQLRRQDALIAARKELEEAGLCIELRPGGYDAVIYAEGVQWNSLHVKAGHYVPHRHRERLERIAQITTHVEECVRILWYLSTQHGDPQAEQEAARNEWPVFRFIYNAQVTVNVTGTPAQRWIGDRLLQDLIREAFPGMPFNLADNTLTFDPHDVDVRLLRERLYDPEACIRAAGALASKAVAAWRGGEWNPDVSYWSVAECLVGCLLDGRQAEASEVWKSLRDCVRCDGVVYPIDHIADAPSAQGTSVLRARCMILRFLRITEPDDLYWTAFEAIAKELDWRDPDLGAEERCQFAIQSRRQDRSKAWQIHVPALPMSQTLFDDYVSATMRLDPQQSFLADLLSSVTARIRREAHSGTNHRSVFSEAWTHLAFDPPGGLKPEALAKMLQASTLDGMRLLPDSDTIREVRWPGFGRDRKTDAFLPALAALFARMIRVNKQAAWATMNDAIRWLTTDTAPDAANAARELLDAVRVEDRGADWHALHAHLSHQSAQPTVQAALPVSQPTPGTTVSLQRWLASPPLKDGKPLTEKTLQAVMALWLTLRSNDEAGADELLMLFLEAPDGTAALAAIADGRLAATWSAVPDITNTQVGWAIGPGVGAFESLYRLALLLVRWSHPAGIGLLNRLMRSQMSPPLRDKLLQEVMQLWNTASNRHVRAISHAGWANFFALALRQPGLPEDIVAMLKQIRLKILQRWQQGAYTIAAPVILVLLDSRVLPSDRDDDEAKFLRLLYAQADSAAVRRWVRQRAMWLGMGGQLLPQEDDPSRANHRQILQWLLAQRGVDLRPTLESCALPSVWDEVMLLGALAACLDPAEGARLLLRLKPTYGLQGAVAEVALKLPSSTASNQLRTQLVRQWCTLGSDVRYHDINAVARTAAALNRLLIAEGSLDDSAALKSWMQGQLEDRSLDWDSGEIRP